MIKIDKNSYSAELLCGSVVVFGNKKYKAVKVWRHPYYTWVKSKEPVTEFILDIFLKKEKDRMITSKKYPRQFI